MILVLVSLFAAGTLAATPASPSEIAKADPALLRALASGTGPIRVLIGLADGTPLAHALKESPDPGGEPARRVVRLAAQRRLVGQMPAGELASPRFYENFSMMAAIATPDDVRMLADRGDVAWLALDDRRQVQVDVQPPQKLIRSDQANALGFTGRGQTVAVLDTGVDGSVPVLGGAPIPNGKVVAGFNVTEPAALPYDCEGHGTSVAAIVATAFGVAPDAKIVAIKVFPGCEGFTYDSLIIEGINIAINHRAQYGIGAINMSIGGPADQGDQDLGFCDTVQPQFATAVDAATAAGMVVVVSSGNGALVNRLSSPACVSSAVSVGAVYSTAQRNVNWGTFCNDPSVQPGDPVCFSNGNTNLTLLAPGAFWNVPTAGGEIISFSGTSAAAPAVSGAVALVRAVRPDLPPTAVVSLLRATGRPITDQRNGVVTPLIDALAAVQFAPSTFGDFTGGAIPIPDGSGFATATATVTGFTGNLASVQTWVEIDHPDPRQLRLTLTGPDGTSVVLHDQSGKPEHPINVVYGGTEASLFPLSAFASKEANGDWTLTVEDLVSGITGRIIHFSVTPIAGPVALPIEAIPADVDGDVVPVVAHTLGTKFFQSDVRIYNASSDPRDFSLYFVGSGQNGSTAVKSTRTIEAGHVLALNDIVFNEFNISNSLGELTVVADDPAFLVQSRSYTRGDNGTYGLAVPAFKSLNGLAAGGGTATANGLERTEQFHSNAGFTEVSGSPVSVRIDVRNGNGTLVGTTTRSAEANTTLLVPDILLDRGIAVLTNARVDFTVVSPLGRIIPFATVVDKFTGDSIFRAAIVPPLSGGDIAISQAAHIDGATGLFQTQLDITNLGGGPVTVTVSLLPMTLPEGVPLPAPQVYTIAPGETLEKPDVLQTEFGLFGPAAAGLLVRPAAPARLAVSSWTFSTNADGGTSGFSIDGVPVASALSPGNTATAIQLDQTDASNGFRTIFGFTEVAGADVIVEVTAKSGDTGDALATKDYFLPAYTSFQASITDLLGAGAAESNFYLQYTVTAGVGKVIAYAAPIDNLSGDVTYFPAQ